MVSVGVASIPHIRALTCRQFIYRTGRQDLNWLHTTQGRDGDALPRNIAWANYEGGRHAKVATSTRVGELDRVALDALGQWRLAPTERECSAVAVSVSVSVILRMHGR